MDAGACNSGQYDTGLIAAQYDPEVQRRYLKDRELTLEKAKTEGPWQRAQIRVVENGYIVCEGSLKGEAEHVFAKFSDVEKFLGNRLAQLKVKP